MPSFIVHGLIPPLVLLAVHVVPRRVALTTAPLTFLADLDHFVGIPRATGHSLLIVAVAAVAWYGWREVRPRASLYAGAATYYLASHVVMDTFSGGVVAFWPFWNRTFLVDCRVLVETETKRLMPRCNPETYGGTPTIVDVYTWISPFEVAMVAWTALALGAVAAIRWWRVRGGAEQPDEPDGPGA